MAALAPIYNASGLISGYQGQKPKMPLSLQPRYSPSGLLTGYSPGTVTGAPPVAPEYSGGLTTPANTASGKLLSGGAKGAQTPGQAAAADLLNNSAVVALPKNPAITTATANLLGDSQHVADAATKTFDDYLNEAKSTTAGIKTQVATDTANLNAIPAATQARIDAINQNYSNTTGNIADQYANLNRQNAATVAGDISKLGTIDSNYATAAQAVADRAVQYAGGQISKYQGGSGTPTSNSSDLENRYQQAYTDINLPVQKEIYANNRADLQNYVTPLQQQLYGENVAADVNYGTTRANQIASMQTGSAEQIAALKQAVAGRGVNEAMAYMQSIGIPISVAQSVLSGPTSNLATLTGVDNSNTNYGIASAYSPAVTSLPTYPAPQQRQPSPQLGGYGNGPVTTGAQPMGATAAPSYAVDASGQPITNGNGQPIVAGSPEFYQQVQYGNPNSPSWQKFSPGNGMNQYQAALAMYQAGYSPTPPNPADYGLTGTAATNPATSNQVADAYASMPDAINP